MKTILVLIGLLSSSNSVPENCDHLYKQYLHAKEMMDNNPTFPSLVYITELRKKQYDHCVDMYNKARHI